MYKCPCCGNYTIDAKPPGTDEICRVCFWHDDCDRANIPDNITGANHVSLNQARKNFKEFGAIEKRFIDDVRPPKENELTGEDWV